MRIWQGVVLMAAPRVSAVWAGRSGLTAFLLGLVASLALAGQARAQTSDLSVTLVDTPDPAAQASTLRYTVSAANAGPNEATGVVVSVLLSPDVFLDSAPVGCLHGPLGTVICALGDLAASASVDLDIDVVVSSTAPVAGTKRVAPCDATEDICSVASITGDQADPVAANDSVDEPTDVVPPTSVAVTKTSSSRGDPVLPGSTLYYRIAVENTGPNPLNELEVTDLLPPGVTYVPGSAVVMESPFDTYLHTFDGGVYNGWQGALDWSSSPWSEINDDGNPGGGDIKIDTDGLETVLQIKQDSTGIERTADLSSYDRALLRYKSRPKDLIDASEFVVVEVSDSGPAGPWTELERFVGPLAELDYAESEFDISNYISASTTIRFSSSNNLGGSIVYFDDVEIEVDTGVAASAPPDVITAADNITVPSDGLVYVLLEVTVDDPALVSTLQNDVTINGDALGGSLTASVTDAIAGLAVSKRSDAGGLPVEPGSTLRYTVLVENNSPGILTGVSLTDAVPAGASYVPGSAVVVVPPYDDFLDEFTLDTSYSRSNGTVSWATQPWVEFGDDADPEGGDIRIESDLGDFSLRLKKDAKGVTRTTDLSAYAQAFLTLDCRRADLDASTQFMTVDVSASGAGGPWTELVRISGPIIDTDYIEYAFDISDHISSTTAIRLASTLDGKEVFCDDVRIEVGTAVPANAPPGIVVAGDGYSLNPGETMAVVFEVLVDDPNTETELFNQASATANELSANFTGEVTDPVAGLQLQKFSSADGGPVDPSTPVTYRLVLDNTSSVTTFTGIDVSDAVPAGTTYLPASVLVVAAPFDDYQDEFAALLYDGTDGTVDWSTSPWTEVNDDGSPTGGDIRVVSDLGDNALRLKDKSTGALRTADLSAYQAATLRFEYRRKKFKDQDDFVTVEISNSGAGGPWSTLDRIDGVVDEDSAYTEVEYDVTDFISATTSLRFVTSPVMDGKANLWIDSVQFEVGAGVAANDPPQIVAPADGYTLSPGGRIIVLFDVTVDDPPGVAQVTNTGSATANETAGIVTSQTVDTVGGLFPTKISSANGGPVNPFDTITYSIDIENRATGPTNNVVVTDNVPAGTSYVPGTARVLTHTTSNEFYLDDFAQLLDYSNSAGSLDWSGGAWVETGDDGDPDGGDIRIEADLADNRLRISDKQNRIEREVNLFGYSEGTLSMSYRRDGLGGSDRYVTLEISASGSNGPWVELDRFAGPGTDAGYVPVSYDITDYMGVSTVLRFSSSPDMAGGEDVFIDDVRVDTLLRLPQINVAGDPPNLVIAADGYDIFPNERMTVTFDVTVDDPAGVFTIENTASATSDEFSMPATSQTSDFVNVIDLGVSVDDGVEPVVAGNNFTYTVDVDNGGPATATEVAVTVVLDPDLSYVSDTVGCVEAPIGTLTCDVGSIVALGSTSFDITVAVDPGASFAGTLQTAPCDTTEDLCTDFTVDGVESEVDASDNTFSEPTDSIREVGLSLTKTDGVLSYTPGSSLTYTLVVANAGPGDVPGATVTDTFPAELQNVNWTCSGTGGATCSASGSGDLSDSASIPAGESVTYTVTADVDSAATADPLLNTASVSVPAGVTELAPADNSDSDSDTLDLRSDLSVDKDDGSAIYTPGVSLTYTITVDNLGPSDVSGATVTDTFPPELLNVNWTCAGTGGASCTASGSGNISDSASIPAGEAVTYTVTADADSASTSDPLVNTASAAVPGGVTDPVAGNNSATDSNILTYQTDLAVDKDDGSLTYTPGTSLTYTITVGNNGPSDANDATITDTFPAELSNVLWTCSGTGGATCTASGSGDIGDTVEIPAGESITYTISADVDPGATADPLVNTATSAPGPGAVDPVGGNDADSDSDTLDARSDLSVTKDDGSASYTPGTALTYTIVVANAGPSDVTGATVTDSFPAELTNENWTCAGTGGATCTASGSGDISDSVNIPAGESVTYTVTADALASATTDPMVNTASAAVPAGWTDSVPANNSDSDSDTLDLQSDASITKTDGSPTYTPGTSLTYTIVVSNAGPSDLVNATAADTFPAELGNINWTCAATGSASCTAAGSGNISDTVSVPVGETLTYTVTADADSAATTDPMVNTATIAVPGGVTDSLPANNSATDSDTLDRQADLSITKDDGSAIYTPGTSLTYTIVVANAGPSDVVGATVADTFPAEQTNVNWTCSGTGTATCTASGSGNISESADIPSGESVTFVVTVDVIPTATADPMVNTATVTAPAGVTDSVPANNSDSDSDTLQVETDLAVTKDSGSATYTPGNPQSYTITVSNLGPSDALGATVTDTFTAELLSIT